MIRVLRLGSLLAFLQVVGGILLFFAERSLVDATVYDIARSILFASVPFFAFTLLELVVCNALKAKDSYLLYRCEFRVLALADATHHHCSIDL